MFGPRHAPRPLCALLAIGLVLCFGGAAAASETVNGEVMVVLAKEEVGETDKALSALPALKKPPFNAFKSMKLLSTTAVTLDKGKPAVVKLPNGQSLQLVLVERKPDGRYKVQVLIEQPKKKEPVRLLLAVAPGEPLFVAGQKHDGGTLVIGVRVGAAKAAATPKK